MTPSDLVVNLRNLGHCGFHPRQRLSSAFHSTTESSRHRQRSTCRAAEQEPQWHSNKNGKDAALVTDDGGDYLDVVLGPLSTQSDRQLPRRPVVASSGCAGYARVVDEIPEDPCEQCGGTGRTLCGICKGKGRINYRDAAMLPQGKWPSWCFHCRGTGSWSCERCYGTGKHRDPIGFRI